MESRTKKAIVIIVVFSIIGIAVIYSLSNKEIDNESQKFTNQEYGYSILVPKDYIIEEQTIGSDPNVLPWYVRKDFLLSSVLFKDPALKNKIILHFRLLNTTDIEKIIASGGWETARDAGEEMVGGYKSKIIKIDPVELYTGGRNIPTEMIAIIKNDKSYVFLHYLNRENIEKIISNFEF